MPTALAQKMGADELVCVDLEGVGITRPNRTGLPTTLIRSYWELGTAACQHQCPHRGIDRVIDRPIPGHGPHLPLVGSSFFKL